MLSASLSVRSVSLSVVRFGGRYREQVRIVDDMILIRIRVHSSPSSSRSGTLLADMMDLAYMAVSPHVLFCFLRMAGEKFEVHKGLGIWCCLILSL